MTQQEKIQDRKLDLLEITFAKNSTRQNDFASALVEVKMIRQKAAELNNDFIKSVSESVLKYKNISEKQAYCLARFDIENEEYDYDFVTAHNFKIN